MDILKWIQFGKVAAERDELLNEYFFDNGVLKKVIDNKSNFLVLGRKGAGKTAVFRHLAENPYNYIEDTDILVPLSFEDYKWNVHRLLSDNTAAESLAYRQSWKFVIYVEAIKVLCETAQKKGDPLPTELRTAQKLLRKIFDQPIPTMGQLIGNKLLRLSRFKLPGGALDLEGGGIDQIEVSGGEVDFTNVDANPELQNRLTQNVENLIGFLHRALLAAAFEGTVYLCFDRVDEAWDEISVDTSKRVIAGLVSAADSVSADFDGALRPIVFLREDIFNVLSLNDANKLREDCGELLKWDRTSLFNLLLVRINYFAQRAGVREYTDIADLFDKKEMRQRAKPANYLLKRTMMRPRDLICFFNKIVQAMKDQASDPFEENETSFSTLQTEAVYAAEPGYSEWLRKEIVDEWGAQKPAINDYFAALQNNGSTQITLSEFQEHYGLDEDVERAELLEHLRFLFENSILGLKQQAGNSVNWRYKCFHESQGFTESDPYKIHDGLVRSLNLVEPRERDSNQQEES